MTESTSDRRHTVLFQARMSVFYHERMEWWLGLLMNLNAFLSILLGSAAIISASEPKTVAVFGILIALSNALVLSFSVQRSMMTHGHLRRKWLELTGRAESATDETIAQVEEQFHTLNGEEPPPITWLLNRAHDATSSAMGLAKQS